MIPSVGISWPAKAAIRERMKFTWLRSPAGGPAFRFADIGQKMGAPLLRGLLRRGGYHERIGNGFHAGGQKSRRQYRYPPLQKTQGRGTLIRDGAHGGVAQAFDLAAITNTVGAPFLRALCEGAGTTNACSCAATPPDSETKSSSSPHSPAPVQFRPRDRNDSCSTATLPLRRPALASPDCDAYTSASPPASSSSIR